MSVKTINGVAMASIKTVVGIAIATVKTWLGITAEPPWRPMNATDFTLGDTGNWVWTSNSVNPGATDSNIRTSLTYVAAGQDFDIRVFIPAGIPDNSTSFGFHDNGTATGGVPTSTDDIVFSRNGDGSAGAFTGWLHGNTDPDGANKSIGWQEGHYIQYSRRGTVYYGLIDGVLDKTYAEVAGDTAGGFFLGTTGGSHDFTYDSVECRLGPGLPAIS